MSNLTQNTSRPTTGGSPCHGLIEFVTLELIWALYICTGHWNINEGLRGLSFFEGLVHLIIENIWRGKLVFTTSWFATFWVGRLKIKNNPLGIARLVVFLVWLLMDTIAIWIEAIYWWNVGIEAMVMVGLVSYQFTQIKRRRRRKEAGWGMQMAWLWVWGPGWVIINGLCLLEFTSSLPLILWYTVYRQLFPAKSRKKKGDLSGLRTPARTTGHLPPVRRHAGALKFGASQDQPSMRWKDRYASKNYVIKIWYIYSKQSKNR